MRGCYPGEVFKNLVWSGARDNNMKWYSRNGEGWLRCISHSPRSLFGLQTKQRNQQKSKRVLIFLLVLVTLRVKWSTKGNEVCCTEIEDRQKLLCQITCCFISDISCSWHCLSKFCSVVSCLASVAAAACLLSASATTTISLLTCVSSNSLALCSWFALPLAVCSDDWSNSTSSTSLLSKFNPTTFNGQNMLRTTLEI